MTSIPDTGYYGNSVGKTSCLLVSVLDKNLQEITACIKKVYWQQSDRSPFFCGDVITYLGQGEAWGRVAPVPGQDAIVFVRSWSAGEALYEGAQHLRVESVKGRECVVHFYDIKKIIGIPSWIVDEACVYQDGPYYFSSFSNFEKQLCEIAQKSVEGRNVECGLKSVAPSDV